MLRGTRSFKHVFYRIKHILFSVGSISLTPDCIGSRLDSELYKSTRLSFSYFSPGPFKFTDTLMSKLRMYKEEKNPSKQTIGLDSNYLMSENPNFVVYQVSPPFEKIPSLHSSYYELMILLGSLIVEKNNKCYLAGSNYLKPLRDLRLNKNVILPF